MQHWLILRAFSDLIMLQLKMERGADAYCLDFHINITSAMDLCSEFMMDVLQTD